MQVYLWRLPQLGADADSSAALVGSVQALPPAQCVDRAPPGTLAWTAAPGAEECPLLVAGNADNSQLALYGLDADASQLQLLQVSEPACLAWGSITSLLVVLSQRRTCRARQSGKAHSAGWVRETSNWHLCCQMKE